MSMRSRVGAFWSVAAMLITAASCVESQKPLSDEKTSIVDERLLGKWVPEGENDTCLVRRSDAKKNAMEVVAEKLAKDEAVNPDVFFTTTIQSRNYASWMQVEEGQGPEPDSLRVSYHIVQYEFRDDETLNVRFLNPDAVSKAIQKGQLAGKIVKKRPVITASPDEIAKFLTAHAEECYPKSSEDSMVFKRKK